jgi:GNAT superfamily N-acetyltransferase
MNDDLQVMEEPIARLDEHAKVPIDFQVDRILVPSTLQNGLSGIGLDEAQVVKPWVKDYDAEKGEGPTRWSKRFDTSNWGLLSAWKDSRRLGGIVVAFNTEGLDMLSGRSDVAVIWDLRVHPNVRSSGVGTSLFRAAEDWAIHRRCRILKVETQNINLPACRLYARAGCTLRAIDLDAYPDLPGEARLVWAKALDSSDDRTRTSG